MNKLISLLQEQHRGIERRTASIQAALDARDSVRIYVELPVFRAGLVSHLKLEDSELYPGMVRIGEALGDDQLVEAAKTFSRNMKQLTGGLEATLQRHDRRQLDLDAFSHDWKSVIGLLGSRIRSEEESLYPLYEAAWMRPVGAVI